MLNLDIEKLPREIFEHLKDDEGVKDQIEVLGSPGGRPSTRKLIDYAERGLIHSPVAGRHGGKSVRRAWLPWIAAMYDVATRLAGKRALAEVSDIVRFASFMWSSVGNLPELLAHAHEFSGRPTYEQPILYWLRMFSANLKMLDPDWFGNQLHYFNSDSTEALVHGLTHGYVDGYSLDRNGNLIPPKRRFDPEKSLKSFASAGPMTFIAKGRE